MKVNNQSRGLWPLLHLTLTDTACQQNQDWPRTLMWCFGGKTENSFASLVEQRKKHLDACQYGSNSKSTTNWAEESVKWSFSSALDVHCCFHHQIVFFFFGWAEQTAMEKSSSCQTTNPLQQLVFWGFSLDTAVTITTWNTSWSSLAWWTLGSSKDYWKAGECHCGSLQLYL